MSRSEEGRDVWQNRRQIAAAVPTMTEPPATRIGTARELSGCRDRAAHAWAPATAEWLRKSGCQPRRLPQPQGSGRWQKWPGARPGHVQNLNTQPQARLRLQPLSGSESLPPCHGGSRTPSSNCRESAGRAGVTSSCARRAARQVEPGMPPAPRSAAELSESLRGSGARGGCCPAASPPRRRRRAVVRSGRRRVARARCGAVGRKSRTVCNSWHKPATLGLEMLQGEPMDKGSGTSSSS